jgi:hypothetical protein
LRNHRQDFLDAGFRQRVQVVQRQAEALRAAGGRRQALLAGVV